MEILIRAVVWISGIVVGAVLATHSKNRKRVGKLRMMDDDGETYLFMEVNQSIQSVISKKEVVLEVDLTPVDFSHK